jgi:hypothetical protein
LKDLQKTRNTVSFVTTNVSTTPSGVINVEEEEEEEYKPPTVAPVVQHTHTPQKRKIDQIDASQTNPKRKVPPTFNTTILNGSDPSSMYSHFHLYDAAQTSTANLSNTIVAPTNFIAPPVSYLSQKAFSNSNPSQNAPSIQPFTPKVILIPTGALLHEDKQTGTRVLVLQTQEQYDRVYNQLNGT